jgi:beta-glucosidase/6-phospho-beta-glucosidase/beta-galactosidase
MTSSFYLLRLLAVSAIAPMCAQTDDLTAPPIDPSFLSYLDQQNSPFHSLLPDHVGYASSMFQDSGIGSKYSATQGLEGTCHWDPWLTPKHIDKTREEDFLQFFIDILGNPLPYIQILKELGSTAYRFSLEWSVIQPTHKEGYNLYALDLYRRFILLLKENHIEPFVTLHHFVHPLWFEEIGAFKFQANSSIYQQYALDMIKIFPEVAHWYTFNEIGAFTLECLLKDHPSQINSLDQAGQMLSNMLKAHCEIYQKAKVDRPEAQIGITHQWLKFHAINGNPLENLLCHLAEKVAHQVIYEFFKTGQFTFQAGVLSNVNFSIPPEEFKQNNGFLDHIGLQFYGPAHIILGGNGGLYFPGHRIYNLCSESLGLGFSFGGTCPPGKSVMSFGPTVDPKSLSANLQEAVELGHPIHISELGCDARTQTHGNPAFEINEEQQKQTFKEYVPILTPYKDHITALFIWTLHTSTGYDDEGRLKPAQLEWNRGAESALGICKISKNEDRQITGYELRPVGEWLQKHFQKKRDKKIPPL